MVNVHDRALAYAETKYPHAHQSRRLSFAASVEELVTGEYNSKHGPTIRSHLVSWSLAGPKGTISVTRTEKYERITVIYPDGTMTRAGQWDYSDAIQYATPIVFGPLGKQARQVIEQEYYFDDDPADLELLIKQIKVELSINPSDRLLDVLLELKRNLKTLL